MTEPAAEPKVEEAKPATEKPAKQPKIRLTLGEGDVDLTGKRLCSKKILREGEGEDRPEKDDEVSVHYTGRLQDGTVFDSSVDRGEVFKFTIGQGQVIKGWDTGVATMLRGEKAIITCAPSYAYGANGSPPKIPPNATLKFEVELITWRGRNDLTDDGGVRKKQTKHGKGFETPRDTYEIDVHVETRNMDGTLVGTTREGAPFTFIVGETTVSKAMNIAVKSMKRRERGMYNCMPEYAAGPPHNPPGSAMMDIEVVGWRRVEEATPDKGVIVKHLNHIAGYEFPNEGSRLKIHYTVKNVRGEVVETTREGEPINCIGLSGDLMEGLEKGLTKIKLGSHAIFTVQPQYAYGPEGKPPLVQPGEPVTIEVDLIAMEKQVSIYILETFAEKLAVGNERREEGNRLFNRGKIEQASKKYETVIGYFKTEMRDKTDEQKAQIRAITFPSHLNLALCLVKMNEGRKAVDNCNKVLEIEPNNIKGLYRRGLGYTLIKQYADGEKDFVRVLELDPANKAAEKELARVKRLAVTERGTEKSLYARMIG